MNNPNRKKIKNITKNAQSPIKACVSRGNNGYNQICERIKGISKPSTEEMTTGLKKEETHSKEKG